MKRQFVRLFLLILFSLVVIAWVTEVFIEHSAETPASINVGALKSLINLQKDNSLQLSKSKIISIDKLAWPASLIAKISNGEVVSLSNIEDEVFYYWQTKTDTTKVLQLGPFINEKRGSGSYFTLTIIFYAVFGICLFVWLWPIFKDVIQLINLTNAFSKKPIKIKSKVNTTSVMYPLAESVESMSRQIVRFLSLQRFLASSVSHDIRTPLSRIGFLLAMTNTTNLDEYKGKIENELDEIDHLTDDFIELARIEECHHQLKFVEKNIVDWLVPLVEKIQTSSEISIELISSSDSVIRHDAQFLQRAIQNVIVNAVKYAVNRVTVTLEAKAQHLEIRVEDDGMGIKPEEQERLIGLYERGKSANNVGSGYGIGLAFVNVITEWHGGHVIINQSTPLNGASISVLFPKSSA
jgi:signal transduction histidine kinase